MDKIPFEDGTLVKAGYVEIDGNKYETVQPEYTGKTPLSAYNLKKMQDNVENAINDGDLVKKIKISGVSKQETREGYNLVDFSNPTNKLAPYSFENDILVVSSSYQYANINWNLLDLFKTNAGKTVYFKSKEVDSSNAISPTAQLTITNNGTNSYINLFNTLYTIPTDTSNLTKATFGIYCNNSSTDTASSITITEPMLVFEGNAEKPYEQYGASPSIEYESPIESVGDNINYLPYPYTNTTKTENGVTFTDNGDGTIDIKGTATKDTFFYLYSGNIANFGSIAKINNKNVVLKELSGKISDRTIQISLYNADNSGKSTYLNKGTISSAITINNQSQSINSAIVVKSGVTVNVTLRPMLVLENASTGAYSPYGQGSIEIKQSARNLANYTDEVTSSSIVNFDIGDVVKGKNYTIYIDLKGTLSFNLKYKLLNTTIKTIYNKTGIYVYNFTATETDILHFNGFSGNGYTGAKVMLLEGTYTTETIPPYEKYQGQTKALYTQQPFRAIGDVKDRFVKVDGANKEQHHIKRIIADGVNYLVGYVFPMGYAMLKDSTKTNIVAKAVKDWAKNGNIICNKLKTVSQADIQQRSYSGVAINNEGYVMIKLDDSAEENIWTTESINNFLSENPLTIDYELATPTLIECTPEQVEALNDIYSAYGKGMTNIICNDEIEPVIEIVKETKETVQSDNDKAISALMARVEELESIVATLQNTTAEEGA